MKRQKDEKITGAKFILDDLVFFLRWNPNEGWMNGPSQEIAQALVGLLYKVKDSIVKIAFADNEEINEYLWNKTG